MRQGTSSTAGSTGRRRLDAAVENLAAAHLPGESMVELAHDARNMVTALSLYCDLLEEPGVLASAHRHYAGELRLVAEASRRLVEKLSGAGGREPAGSGFDGQGRLFGDPLEPERTHSDVIDMREELLACRNLLAAIAGPSITLTVNASAGTWPVAMTVENLVRILVNLVRNSAEAIGGPGTIELHLTEQLDGAGGVRSVVLVCEDSGAGIPEALLSLVFEPGFTTHPGKTGGNRGLGLAITRCIVEGAGGSIHAENRLPGPDRRGTRLVIQLPVRQTRPRNEKREPAPAPTS